MSDISAYKSIRELSVKLMIKRGMFKKRDEKIERRYKSLVLKKGPRLKEDNLEPSTLQDSKGN